MARKLLAYSNEKMRHAIIFFLAIMLTQVPTEARDVSQTRKPYGGTLVWGTCHKPTIINPILSTYSISASLVQIIFNGLVRINSKGEIEPDLAESWDISNDGLIYTFYLRKGVKFHDGKECTAFDVKFTYDKIIDPQVNSPFRESFQRVNAFEAVDKYTFKVVLREPCAPFIYRMIRYMMPKHILEGKDLNKTDFNFHPIGTGPFKFKEWTKDGQIILEHNLDYYEGRPYLDRIIVKSYSDSRMLWTALMRGEIDFMLFIERDDYQVLKDDPAFKSYAISTDYYYALTYNLNDPILIDKRVREAIAYGVDRKSLIERVAGGYGLECKGPFHPECLGFNPSVKPLDYHPEKSQELLAQAGWQDTDNDGILEKNGEELEIRVLVDTRNEVFKRIAMVLRQQLQEIGIKIEAVLFNDENELTEEFLRKNRPQARLKLFLAGYVENIAEDWGSKESKRANKLWIYNNEKVDRLIELGEMTLEEDERQKIYQEIHQIIYADQPACFLYFRFEFHAVSKNFKNTDEFFTLSMPFYTLKDWYLDTADERRYYKDTRSQDTSHK
jgi:peptide/nickel transport system substrate-binding protein